MSVQPAVNDSPHFERELAAAQRGTDNQLERYLAGYLPEDELLALARTELFKPFDGFKRWNKDARLYARDVKHDRKCEKRGEPGFTEAIVFETAMAVEFSHDEWLVYRRIGDARDVAARHDWLDGMASVTIEPLAHFATCSVCQAEACRMSVKITITWAGRVLAREYVLQ